MKWLLLAIAVLCLTSSARGQHWQQVMTPWGPARDTAKAGTCQVPYFLNSNIGFVYTTTNRHFLLSASNKFGISPAHLFRTLDGGQSWTFVQPFEGENVSIQQLFFTSLSHGYIVIDSTYSTGVISGMIFETFDTGNTWLRITAPDFCPYTVYAAHDLLFATGAAPRFFNGSMFSTLGIFPWPDSGALYRSTDDGTTWAVVPGLPQPMIAQVKGNRDSLVFALSEDALTQTYITFSLDLGRTWSTVLLDRMDTGVYAFVELSATAFPYSCEVVRMWDGLQQYLNDVTSLYTTDIRSSPLTWQRMITHEIGAWVAGTSCAKYISDAAYRPDSGLIRSIGTDTNYVGGPSLGEADDGDFPNLSVVGHGSVVYVGTPYTEALWKTTDGGDGTLSEAALAPEFALSHVLSSGANDTLYANCTNARLILIDQNLSCSRAIFTDFSITGLDAAEYSISRTHHSICESLPDTSIITIAPSHSGLRDVTIQANYVDDEFNKIDTSIAITLLVKSGPAIPLDIYLRPNTLSRAGDTISIPVYLSGNLTLTDATSLSLLFSLDTNMLRVLSFNPSISGITVGSLSYSKDTETVPLQATDLTVNGETLIGTLKCIVYLADALQTSVTLVDATLSGEDSRCVALSLQTNAVNIALTGCGDSTLLRFMQKGLIPLAILSIRPNPASNSVDIGFANPTASAISYQVMDALGVVHIEGTTNSRALTLDVHSLATGFYYVRARNASGSTAWKFLVSR